MHAQPLLVRPAIDYLPSYTHALAQGWSLDLRGPAAAAEQRARVEQDPAAFLAALENRAGQGAPLQLPDGSLVPRLPGIQRWIWDGEFCGAVSLRWVEGSAELPAYCLGHVGYGVVPWKRGRGYASSALGQILPEARAIGLRDRTQWRNPGESVHQARTVRRQTRITVPDLPGAHLSRRQAMNPETSVGRSSSLVEC